MSENLTERWNDWMREALSEGTRALAHGDVPVGALVVSSEGRLLAKAHNRREVDSDPTAHAEILVLRSAAAAIGDWRLEGCTLVVTLEPCPMCAMAALWARAERIVYGAADLKAGGVLSLYNIPQDERLNHRLDVIDGVLDPECSAALTEFFEGRRNS